MRRYFTRGDIVLVSFLSLLSLASLGGVRSLGLSGNHAVVEVDGQHVLELSLDRPAITPVQGPLGETVIEVSGGTVRILSSPCPHDHCIHMGRIRHVGEILVCVPNRVFVTVRGDGGGERVFDGVSE